MDCEDKEWIAHERGWKEGYNAGIVNFEAVKKEIEKLERKGLLVILMTRKKRDDNERERT